jgi:hypothetical protein
MLKYGNEYATTVGTSTQRITIKVIKSLLFLFMEYLVLEIP